MLVARVLSGFCLIQDGGLAALGVNDAPVITALQPELSVMEDEVCPMCIQIVSVRQIAWWCFPPNSLRLAIRKCTVLRTIKPGCSCCFG